MKHTDYKHLTGRLNAITKEFNRTRLLLSSPSVDEDGNPGPINRGPIWLAIIRVDNDLSKLMDGLVDEFVATNQARADQGHPATEDVRVLIQAMDGFMLATSTPVPKIGIPYVKTRQRANEWMKMANTWFPGLDSRPTPTTIPVTVDRKKMAKFFQKSFNKQSEANEITKFVNLCRAIESGLKERQYTPTDIGRIAYQVRQSKWIEVNYSPRLMSFAKFARLFFDACGVKLPRDPSPSRYKDPGKCDYSCWLT